MEYAANLGKLAKQQIDAYIPDNGYRQRDERYADQDKHKAKPDPLWDKSAKPKKAGLYKPSDFQHDLPTRTCICPAGKKLYGNSAEYIINGYKATKYQGTVQDCGPCDRCHLCLRTPEKTRTRQVSFFYGKVVESHTDRMKRKIDTDEGRAMITRRFATVEPVFGNLRGNKWLDRFTLRGQKRWIVSGNCTVWFTTLKNWPIMVMRREEEDMKIQNMPLKPSFSAI